MVLLLKNKSFRRLMTVERDKECLHAARLGRYDIIIIVSLAETLSLERLIDD